VDDSVVIRRLVTQALSEDPLLEVVGTAANGIIALQKIPQINPDVITLDVEMPEMDGLTTLRELRKDYPSLCVIMFSTLTERGAATTIDALMLGADDYVAKASNAGSLDISLQRLRQDLIPKIRQFFIFEHKPALAPKSQTEVPAAMRFTPPRLTAIKAPKVLAIGISTGGPNALAEIVPMFPADFPLPIVMVQHMPPMFTQMLAQRLKSKSKINVEEAVEGSLLEAGKMLIAPGNYHMRLKRDGSNVRVVLDQEPPENSCRPAVDVLFRSVSDIFCGATFAAVLTGMGQDGLRGVEQLKADGAYIIAQDEASSVVWGMPGAIVNSGFADSVLDLKAIVPHILRQIG
jgi:two-component system chemotaxis response regulator CheB